MSLFRPRKPSKPGARLSVWLMLFGGLFPFIDDENGKWIRGPNGYRYLPNKTSGGNGRAGFSWQTPYKELDTTLAVTKNTFVYLTPGNVLVTTGMTDAVTNANAISSAGIWQAAQNVPAANAGKYNVPVFPYPSATGMTSGSAGALQGDLDGANVFWIYWGKVAVTPTWNNRGLWTATPASPYMTFDIVQYGSGTSAGIYQSMIDGNTNTPDSGIGWQQISSSQGTWL